MDRGLSELLHYNAWANQALLEVCRGLDDRQLKVARPPTSESIAELLAHLVGSQESYVHWARGEAFETALGRDSAWPGWDAVSSLSDDTSAALIAVAEALDPDDEVDLWHHGAMRRYPVRFLLANLIEHGIRHRTEIARMLTDEGLPYPDVDGWRYGRAVGYGGVVS